MKILFLGVAHKSSWPGGEGKVARVLRSALLEQGMDIQAACFPRSLANSNAFQLFPFRSMSVTDSEIVNAYRRYIQKSRPDVVITCYDRDLSALWASVLSGTPTIAQVMNLWTLCPKGDLFISKKETRCDGPSLSCGPCIARIDRELKYFSGSIAAQPPLALLSAINMNKIKRVKTKLNSSSAIVTCDLFLKNKMVQMGYDSQKIHAIYNGVDLVKTKPVRTERKEKTVLFFAYYSTEHRRALKGCRHFIELSKNLKPEFPDVRFLWVGQEQIRGDSYENKGYVWNDQELQELYKSSYLLLLPSLWPETMSFAIQEAMAHGKPVVAYDTGANREAIVHNETGLLAEWGNVEQLTSHVRSLLMDEQAAKRMGDNARKLSEEKFGIEQMAKNYKKLIEELT